MSKVINIYVEGEGEICFFSHLLLEHYGFAFESTGSRGINLVYKTEGLHIHLRPFQLSNESGGFDNKKIKLAAKEILNNKEKKETNIFIIDADTENHKPAGGFENRCKYLETLKKDLGIEFHYFLIPDHSNSGNLESLLDNLISSNGRPFYDCLSGYSECLSKLTNSQKPTKLNSIDNYTKKKFEWYVYNMIGNGKNSETSLSNRNYSRNDLWDLRSLYLSPLINFLNQYLKD